MNVIPNEVRTCGSPIAPLLPYGYVQLEIIPAPNFDKCAGRYYACIVASPATFHKPKIAAPECI